MTDIRTYPGSVDDGDTDMEYTVGSERIICAQDERHADHEKRIAVLETQVHRLLNAEPHVPAFDPVYQRGYADGAAAMYAKMRQEPHVPEGDIR